MANEFIARKGLIALEDSTVTGSLTVSGSLKVTGSVALNNIPNSSTSNVLYYNTANGTVSYAAAGAGSNPFPFTGDVVISGSLQVVTSGSRAVVVSASAAANYISQSLSQSAIVGATIYGLSISPRFTNTTSSQTQTALRVNPTFTGSFSGSNTTNNIVDFGSSAIGTQFIINDVTSGSIYQVNDSIGIPIIEATSDWVVNMYEGPTNIIFKKSGSAVYMTGSLQGTSSFATTASYATVAAALAGGASAAFPFTGNAIISGSLQIVTSGSTATVVPTGSSANYISQSLSQSAIVGATIYGLSISPRFTNTTSSQTQTALRVNPTFTGSFSSSAINNIVDFGSSAIGSQFIINDVTSGSIYQVNDSFGIPIIEATSDWVVNLYEGPGSVIFKKSGSAVYMTGSLQGTSSFATTASYATVAAALAGGASAAFPFTGNAVISGSLQVVTSGSKATILPTGSSANYISQSLSQSAVVGATIYGMLIAPTFTNTTSSQTQTAFRVNPTFTGSFSGSNTTNNIVDFGSSAIGSQFIINDVTSGSIYQVNDSIGIPIIEATSDWVVNLYEGPTNKVLQKSGSGIYITGLLSMATASTFVLPLSSSAITPKPTGSAYFSGSFLYIWNGSKYLSSSFS